jgi:hypothetical protein
MSKEEWATEDEGRETRHAIKMEIADLRGRGTEQTRLLMKAVENVEQKLDKVLRKLSRIEERLDDRSKLSNK